MYQCPKCSKTFSEFTSQCPNCNARFGGVQTVDKLMPDTAEQDRKAREQERIERERAEERSKRAKERAEEWRRKHPRIAAIQQVLLDKVVIPFACIVFMTGVCCLGGVLVGVLAGPIVSASAKAFTGLAGPFEFSEYEFGGSSEFVASEFNGKLTPGGLLEAIKPSGIPVPKATTELESLNKLLSTNVYHRFTGIVLPEEGMWLIGRVSSLNKNECMRLNRYILEELFPEQCPKNQFVGQFSTHRLIEVLKANGVAMPEAKTELESLNKLLNENSRLHEIFNKVPLPMEGPDLLKRVSSLSKNETARLNRLILEAVFPKQCPKSPVDRHRYITILSICFAWLFAFISIWKNEGVKALGSGVALFCAPWLVTWVLRWLFPQSQSMILEMWRQL